MSNRLIKLADKIGNTETLNSPLRWIYDELQAIIAENAAKGEKQWPFPVGKDLELPTKKKEGRAPKYPHIPGESKADRRRRLDRLRAEEKRNAAAL